jgi:UDPglucose 6-dehydrogenase
MAEAGRLVPEMVLCKDVYEALAGADVMVIVTEWNEFRMIDLVRAKEVMSETRMVDLRNIYDAERTVAAGFEYWGVGR